MVGIQLSVRDSMDNENGSFCSFADVVDSMMYRLYLAMVADDLGSDAHYLSIHLFDTGLDYCKNFPHTDAAVQPMANNQLKPHHMIHCFEPLNWKHREQYQRRFYRNVCL